MNEGHFFVQNYTCQVKDKSGYGKTLWGLVSQHEKTLPTFGDQLGNGSTVIDHLKIGDWG